MKSPFRKLKNSAPVPMSGQNYLNVYGLGYGAPNLETLMRAYGNNPTAFATISLLAQSTARTEWHLYRKQPKDGRVRYTTNDNGSDQRTEVVNHAALKLISNPNPYFTRFELFELDQLYLDLVGESYWIIDRAAGLNFPTAIWSVRPDRMEPVPDPVNYLAGWIYTAPDGREKIPFRPDEIIQVKYPNPLDPYRGIGPTQAVLTDIDSFRYASEWNRTFFINSARPDGVITVPGSWDDTEFRQFEDRWRETHRGVSRASRVALLEGGATWTAASTSPKDMDFSNMRSDTRDVIREAYRIPKVMLGVSDDVNRANAQTGQEVYAAWNVVPRLDRKKDMLNNVFLPMFGSTGEGVEFDYITPVPSDREADMVELQTKASAASYLVNAGYEPHDVLKSVGLPDMDVLEKASPIPAVPPGWVVPKSDSSSPAPEAAPPASAAPTGDEVTNRLLHMLSNGHIPVNAGDR